MLRQVLLCAAFLLLFGAETVAGRLRGADIDPLRNAVYNNLEVPARERKKHVRVPRDDAAPVADRSYSSMPATLAADMTVVHVVATTLKDLRCKPLECAYDTVQSAKAQLHGDGTWSLAPVRAGVFSQGDVEHYLHLVKLCHTMKGAFGAASVAGAYHPETGKVHISLRFPSVSAKSAAQFSSRSAAVNRRISALLAESLITHEAPVVVDKVTVHRPPQPTDT